GCDAALETLSAYKEVGEKASLMKKAYSTLIRFLGDRESLTIEDVQMTLNSRELNKRTKGTKEESGDGLYVRGRPYHSDGHLKRECPMNNSSRYVRKGGSYHMTPKRDFLYDFKAFDGGLIQLGRMKDIKGCQLGDLNQVRFRQLGTEYVVFALRRLEDKKLEEKTNTDCLVKE
ncbi:hypothetical protein Tco_1433886, partial [Tanacetum coccineum]